MQREGICALGNMIVDLLFEVERYPGLGEHFRALQRPAPSK